MPRTLDEAFRDYLLTLTPSVTESAAAQRHRASIEACLERKFGILNFFRMGSFGNGTSVAGFSDVDYFASFPGGVLTQNSAYSLQKLRDALDDTFPMTGVRVNSPAVLVPFGPGETESTEVVPADLVGETREGFRIYDIPDTQGGWMRSSPDAHKAFVRSIDERLGRKLKPLVRFLKAWKFLCNVPVSSFYLEMRAAQYGAEESSIVYGMDLERLFRRMLDGELARMQDPMGITGYISPCVSDAQWEESMSKLETASSRATRAWDAHEDGDDRTAIETLGLVFGGEFPGYYL